MTSSLFYDIQFARQRLPLFLLTPNFRFFAGSTEDRAYKDAVDSSVLGALVGIYVHLYPARVNSFTSPFPT